MTGYFSFAMMTSFPEAFKGLNQFLDEKLAYITADFHVRDERGDHFVKRQDGIRGIENTPKLFQQFLIRRSLILLVVGIMIMDILDLIAYLELNHQFETLSVAISWFHRQHAENASKRSYRDWMGNLYRSSFREVLSF